MIFAEQSGEIAQTTQLSSKGVFRNYSERKILYSLVFILSAGESFTLLINFFEFVALQ